MRTLLLALALGLLCSLNAAAQMPVRIAVLSLDSPEYRPPDLGALRNSLEAALDGRPVQMRFLPPELLHKSVHSHSVDFIIAEPGMYSYLASESNLSAPLASLRTCYRDQPIAATGGAILTRADNPRIQRVQDLQGARIHSISNLLLTGSLAQQAALLEQGLEAGQDYQLHQTNGTRQQLIQDLLDGRADAIFLPAGAAETLRDQNLVDLRRLRPLNPQSAGDYPFMLSTRLYPQWALGAMHQLDRTTSRLLLAALLQLPPHHAALRELGIASFSLPDHIESVRELQRQLRVPPYDREPLFTLADVWHQHRTGLALGVAALALLFVLLTSLVSANRRLQQARERERRIYDTLPGVAYQYHLSADGSSSFPYASARISHIYQGTTAEDVQTDATPVFACIHPEHVESVWHCILESARSLEPWQCDYPVIDGQGGYRWVRGHALPERQPDNSVLWHGFIMDISTHKQLEDEIRRKDEQLQQQLEQRVQQELTRRQQSETKYRNLFNLIPDAVLVHEFTDNGEYSPFMEVNERACELLGRSREELYQCTPRDLVVETDPALFPKMLAQLKRDRQLEREQLLHVPGREEPLLVWRSTRLDQLEGRQVIFTILHDISEQRRLEREHAVHRAQLIQQSKLAELGSMLGAIAHQWKQPLNTISMTSQLIPMLLEQRDDPQSRAELKQIPEELMQQVMFMSQTMDEFQSFYRLDRTRTRIDILQSLEAVLQLLQAQLYAHSIQVQIDRHPAHRTSFPAWGYGGEFKQVILNLINNAKQALIAQDISTPRIDIQLECTHEQIKVCIADNAGGVDPELLPDKLFDPFVSTKDDKGTGIGLSLARTIVEENMHGSISARNTGEGAEFCIELPLADNSTQSTS